MKLIFIFLPVVTLFTSCKKNETIFLTKQFGHVDTATRLLLKPYNNKPFSDMNDNSIVAYTFQRGSTTIGDTTYLSYTNIDSFLGLGNYCKYRITYTGGEELINGDSVVVRNEYSITYQVNKAVIGKQIYQVYDTLAKKSYLTIVAASELTITVNYKGNESAKAIAGHYNRYIKQGATTLFALD